MIDMILEAEMMCVWNRGKTEKQYLQVCTKEGTRAQGEEAWLGKLKEFKRILKSQNKKNNET